MIFRSSVLTKPFDSSEGSVALSKETLIPRLEGTPSSPSSVSSSIASKNSKILKDAIYKNNTFMIVKIVEVFNSKYFFRFIKNLITEGRPQTFAT